jgi:hypothetical protein
MWDNHNTVPIDVLVQPFLALKSTMRTVTMPNGIGTSKHQFQAIPVNEDFVEENQIHNNNHDPESQEKMDKSTTQTLSFFAYNRFVQALPHTRVGLFSFDMFGVRSGLPKARTVRPPAPMQSLTPMHTSPYQDGDFHSDHDVDVEQGACDVQRCDVISAYKQDK